MSIYTRETVLDLIGEIDPRGVHDLFTAKFCLFHVDVVMEAYKRGCEFAAVWYKRKSAGVSERHVRVALLKKAVQLRNDFVSRTMPHWVDKANEPRQKVIAQLQASLATAKPRRDWLYVSEAEGC
jgi:hypothetical protein